MKLFLSFPSLSLQLQGRDGEMDIAHGLRGSINTSSKGGKETKWAKNTKQNAVFKPNHQDGESRLLQRY